jgi:homoserine O-succinyltransferase/O-acetyltransferase
MGIVLPGGHPLESLALKAPVASQRPTRIGIINIMPRLEAYEASLLGPLARVGGLVEPVFIRLESHGYQSSDHEHLQRFYEPFGAAIAKASLDGLIVTGAPVEELAFEDVLYFRELEAILQHARAHIACTLGLCWGGLALGRVLGLDKRVLAQKLFGVFEDRVLVADHDVLGAEATFVCAHSRHSGVEPRSIDDAVRSGVVHIVSRGEHTGPTIFETPDGRFLAHLGHPEYEADRLAFEWKRDRDLGRTDVAPPANFQVDAPVATWAGHRAQVFAGLFARAAGHRTRANGQQTAALTP